MKRIIYSAIACLVIMTGISCRKYVEIDQVGKRTLKYTNDYQYILNNTGLFEPSAYFPLVASDEFICTDPNATPYLNDRQKNVYTWAEDIYGDLDDNEWNGMYGQIYNCNMIITQVMESIGGSDAQKRSALAEAKVQRAFTYFMLVNIYAKQYDASTAATDPGVPLQLQPTFLNNLTRASVATVYQQVLQDLIEAAPDLSDTPLWKNHPSKAAAFAMLARVYLQRGEYEKAGSYADSTLKLQSTVANMNNYIVSSLNIPKRMNDPEYIWSKKMYAYSLTMQMSDEAINMYDTAVDLRYRIYTAPGNKMYYNYLRGYYFPMINGEGAPVGPTVPEMMLIKAEVLARGGNANDAVTLLNAIRVNRFRPADYKAFTAGTADEALKLTLDERRRELLFRLNRWFDQRRLNKDPKFAETETRTLNGVTYTLEPNSNRYVFPIAKKLIAQSPEITQNPR